MGFVCKHVPGAFVREASAQTEGAAALPFFGCESFGRLSKSGRWDLEWIFQRIGPSWRPNEMESMLADWRRAGWIAVDVAAGEFRLAPDRLPGWADCFPGAEPAEGLPLSAGEHIGNMVAEISQARAARSAGS